jgi:hypothetical protein
MLRSFMVALVFIGVTGVLLLVVGSQCESPFVGDGDDGSPSDEMLVQTACRLERKTLLRVWRGQAGDRSPELVLIPREPNFFGALTVPNHSGLTGVDLPQRSGTPLREALVARQPGTPRLILTIVWDGVGRNVLRRWPNAWPYLKSLEGAGTSYLDATVGSSPSITPATHANLGTGTFPRVHRVPAIFYRGEDGDITGALRGANPSMLEVTTFADEIDRRLNNRPLVGMLGWFDWHLPMMGHGKGVSGGDADQVGLIHDPRKVTGNDDFYSTPQYLLRFPGFHRLARRLDRADGALDGEWRGHRLLEADPRTGVHKKNNPAWVDYQSEMLLNMLRREEYGSSDGFPGLFFANFKMADVVGHQYTMDSPEMRIVLRSLDHSLRRIVAYLDKSIEDYVVLLTADHGHTPSPRRSGGWAINANEVAADVDEHFAVPQGETLVLPSRTAGLYLNRTLLSDMSLRAIDVAGFLLDYTIGENAMDSPLPRGYRGRGSEPIFSATFARTQIPDIMRCTYGSNPPPAKAED